MNPGTLLEVTGSFDVHPIPDLVVDRESGSVVKLSHLLASFLEDPEDTITGPIRIRIESAQLAPGAQFPRVDLAIFNQDDPGGLWKEGDIAVDLGPEGPESPVQSILLVRTGETLGLTDPFGNRTLRRLPQ